LRLIALDLNHIQTHVAASVAMTLVHELAHVRILDLGVPLDYDRERQERTCVSEEVDFASRLPASTFLIAGAIKKLESRWWLDGGERLESSQPASDRAPLSHY